MIFEKLLLFIFFISLTFILYYLGRIGYIVLVLTKKGIETNIVEMRNDLTSDKKLIILWISISFFLFYIFY